MIAGVLRRCKGAFGEQKEEVDVQGELARLVSEVAEAPGGEERFRMSPESFLARYAFSCDDRKALSSRDPLQVRGVVYKEEAERQRLIAQGVITAIGIAVVTISVDDGDG